MITPDSLCPNTVRKVIFSSHYTNFISATDRTTQGLESMAWAILFVVF